MACKDPSDEGAKLMATNNETPKRWATSLSPDELDNYRKGNCANDIWSRAAKREAKRRGKCGAMSRDGDICHRVPGHKKEWHEAEIGAGSYSLWDYDMRNQPNKFAPQLQYGKALRCLRQEKRLTQRKLAAKAGLSYSYIAHIESGRKRPTLDMLESICAGLGIKVSDFMVCTENQNQQKK